MRLVSEHGLNHGEVAQFHVLKRCRLSTAAVLHAGMSYITLNNGLLAGQYSLDGYIECMRMASLAPRALKESREGIMTLSRAIVEVSTHWQPCMDSTN